jgi:uncharacterized protein YerC
MIVRAIRPETGRSTLTIMKVRRMDREQRPACMIVRAIRPETGRSTLMIMKVRRSRKCGDHESAAITKVRRS